MAGPFIFEGFLSCCGFMVLNLLIGCFVDLKTSDDNEAILALCVQNENSFKNSIRLYA